jgi:hypothetical protein
MPLNLYRRHCAECEAGRWPDSKSGEFEERKEGWKRCSGSIFVSGTLKGAFKRKSTGLIDWDIAQAAVSKWTDWVRPLNRASDSPPI